MQHHQRQSNPHRHGSSMPVRRATVAVGVICCMLSLATSSCHRNSADNDTHPPSRAIDAAALLVSVADADHPGRDQQPEGQSEGGVEPPPQSPLHTPGRVPGPRPDGRVRQRVAQFRTAVYNGAPRQPRRRLRRQRRPRRHPPDRYCCHKASASTPTSGRHAPHSTAWPRP